MNRAALLPPGEQTHAHGSVLGWCHAGDWLTRRRTQSTRTAQYTAAWNEAAVRSTRYLTRRNPLRQPRVRSTT
jgi:hypothetical protein